MADEGKKVHVEAMDDLWNYWYSELHDHNCGLTLKISKIHYSDQSDFQKIEVVENDFFGKMLVLYGSLMVADNDNNAYNEMITHVPLFSHSNPDEVLIIGGGDCGALTEVLKHPEVKQCTMCELDRKVVEISKQHFPSLTEGLNDPRANLLYEDGNKFIHEGDKKYDVIILDLSDPVGPAVELFQMPFHKAVRARLSNGGILVAQAESPYLNKSAIQAMHANLSSIFKHVHLYTCFMPIYPSGYWAFLFASDAVNPINKFDSERVEKLKLSTRYYNAETHPGGICLTPIC